MRLGAGLLIALGVGAEGGGWWLPVGALLAGVLAWLAPGGDPEPVQTNSPAHRLTGGAWLVAHLGLVPVFASAFAVYLLPGHRIPAAVGVVVVVTAVAATGFTLPSLANRWLLGILSVAGAGLVALCFAVAPERGAGNGPGPLGVFAAAAVVFPFLGRAKARPVTLVAVVAAVLGAAALYQLGPVRLALSDAPLRDVLAAADGQAIEPLLAGVVVLATLPAALRALSEASGTAVRDPARTVVCGLLAAAGAALLDPRQAVLLAGALALVEVLVRSLLTLSSKRDARSAIAAVLSVAVLAWLPPVDLLLTVAALALGALVRLPARRRRA